jgi:hypothetical protein
VTRTEYNAKRRAEADARAAERAELQRYFEARRIEEECDREYIMWLVPRDNRPHN